MSLLPIGSHVCGLESADPYVYAHGLINGKIVGYFDDDKLYELQIISHKDASLIGEIGYAAPNEVFLIKLPKSNATVSAQINSMFGG